MALVVDPSIILSWHFRDEANPHPSFMRRLGAETVVVPGHFAAELANGILIAERRGRADPSQAAKLLDLLSDLDLDIDDEGGREALERILPLARAHRLTIYDALYLEVAERRGLPLATLDGALVRAARSVGVLILEP